MHPSRQVRRRFTSARKRRPYPLLLEILEDRCLLSVGYGQVNLASNVPGVARIADPNLVDPWGMAFSPTGPFWFADAGSGVSDVLDGRGRVIPLVVTVPSPTGWQGAPSGTVFNPGSGFVVSGYGVSQASLFLFAGLDGTITAWAPAVDPTDAILARQGPPGSVYTGLALATGAGGNSFLYAADFGRGSIDVFDQNFQPVARPGAFQDPNLPSNYAPFNIQALDHLLFVTYVPQDPSSGYDVPGAGHGIIDVYQSDGTFVQRFASGGALNTPWGLALAPADFGPLGGALLVGNNGDGTINAYDPSSGAYLGPLAGDNGQAISIPGLWSLAFGNDHEAGAADTLYFTAGPYDQPDLFGAIQSPERRGADTGGAGTYDPTFPGERADYPLPPVTGPGLADDDQEALLPVAALLPLAESSLALAPTLTAAARTASPVGTTPQIALSLDRPAATAIFASGTVFLLPPTQADQTPTADSSRSVAGLNRLLDVNPVLDAPVEVSRPSKLERNPGTLAAPSAPVVPEIMTAGTLTEPQVPARKIRLSAPELSEMLAPSAPTNRLRAEYSSSAPAEVACAVPARPEVAQRSTTWKKVLTAVFPVITITVVWTVLQRHRRRMKARVQRLVRLQRTVS